MGVQERKEREREQRKLDILDAARTVFILNGIQAATMDKIAAQAELAKGTLYLYYKNRDELLLALISMDLEHLNKGMSEVVQSTAPADEKLFRAFETFHSFSKENTLFYQVMTQVNIGEVINCTGGESESLGTFRALNKQMMNMLADIVQEGVQTKVFTLTRPVGFVVMQVVMATKGSMVLMNNGMLPPEFNDINPEEMLNEQAILLIRGLKSKPTPMGSIALESRP